MKSIPMRRLRGWLAALAAVTLAACGGGGSDTPAPSAPPPSAAAPDMLVSGTVTGFGSLVIDGVTYDSSNVAVALDIDPRTETAGTQADLKLGQQVEAMADASGRLTKVTVRAAAVGPVESLNVAANSFKVVGQTVKVVASGEGKTVFEGATGLADLKVNDWVEVHGSIDADKNILATRVEVKPAAGEIKLRAGGLIKELNTTAKTFKLGDLTVNYTNAVIKPDNATLANDVLVFVFSDALPANNVLTARSLRVMQVPTLEGRRFSIGGLVTDAAADGKKFKVNGIQVDATDAELKGGQNPSFADIKNMALVRVEGTLSGSGSTLTVKATRVWIIPASEQRRVILTGQVSDFVSAANFKLRGVSVDADQASFRGGVKADLKDGAFVMIKGRIDGAKVIADEVSFNTPPRDVSFKLFGTVSDYNAGTGEFKLLGIPMKLDAAARFEGGAKADFGNGDVVEVKGSFNGTVFVVTEVEFKPGAFTPVVYLSGTISNVSATGFTLNGATVKINAGTEIENGPLANGQRVEVVATLSNGELTARKVEVQVAGATASLRGPVAELDTTAKTFTVNGQKVDYATASFRGGAATDLANGKQVRVFGAINAGVVKASQVWLLPSMM
jgi:hypothetical protein